MTAAAHRILVAADQLAQILRIEATRQFGRTDQIAEQHRQRIARGTRFPYRCSPRDARWNADRQAVEFGVEVGEYRGVVRVPRRVFQRLLPETPTPERCISGINGLGHGQAALAAAGSVPRFPRLREGEK
jgi:hypothetical protein